MNEFPDFLSDLWNRATGTFDRLIDFEFTRKELDLASDVFRAREAQAFEAQQRQAQFVAPVGSSGGFGVSTGSLVLLAGAGLILLLATRR